MELQKMKKSILAAGALSLAVSFAFGTMAAAEGKLDEPKDYPELAQPSIGGLSGPAVGGSIVLLTVALTGQTTSSTPPTTP